MRTKKILLLISTILLFATVGVLVFVNDIGICISVAILALFIYREFTKNIASYESEEEEERE